MQMFQTILELEKPFTLADFHKDLIHRFDDFVFEGSQGILLDMDHGIFPNVTYANTTSKNAWKYAVGDVDVYYVTRCYQTRHGEGWMSNENEKDEYDDGSNVKLVNNSEEINKFNNWQRDFRIGELDCDMIKHAINVDKCYHPRHIPKTHLVVTCLDQRPDFYFPFDKFKNIVDVMHSNDSPKSDNMKTLTL
jgi:adenylosuccinate synthase